MELPVNEEARRAKMKRFFMPKETASSAAQVNETDASLINEDTEIVTLSNPEGDLVDEGEQSAEEIANENAKVERTLAGPDVPFIPGQCYQYGSSLAGTAYWQEEVLFKPTNPAPCRRSVLIPNIIVIITDDPHAFFQEAMIKADINFSVFLQRTRHLKVKGPDGKAMPYGTDSALIVFEQATDAKEFADKYKDNGALYLSRPSNPFY